jgi:hypothetical protein
MPKGSTWRNDLLKLYFLGTTAAAIADNAASAPCTSLVIALHTGDPGVGNPQTTNEAAYVGYTRATVARSGAGWTVTGNHVNPATNIVFGACTASPGSPIQYWSVSRGSNLIDYVGPLVDPIVMTVGVVPRLTTASEITEE